MLVTLKQIRDVGNSLLGISYKHLGRSVEEGLDCYGLVLEFYRRIYMPLRPYLPPYDIDWFHRQDLFDENAVDFEKVEAPRPGCTISIATRNSPVPNHLMVYLGQNEILNTDQYAGVHITRWFVIRDKIIGYYSRIGITLGD